MKQRILSVTLMLCLCISSQSIVYAGQENLSLQENVFAEESTSGLSARDSTIPTQTEAYNAMIALKDQDGYREGTPWTNFTPYGRDGALGSAYQWNGGPIKGASSGVGCAAFVFLLSDQAFGSLPARAIDRGNFTFADVKVGDILRVNNNSHFVIVLQKSAGGVTVAEGNYNKSVHWGRAMSESEVMNADFIVTRYPADYPSTEDPDADEVAERGTEGSLNWTLTNAGTLTISGSGAIPNYSPNDEIVPSWDVHSDAIYTIVIENGVTGIGDYAFYQSKALSVYIPEGVTSIGQSAFYGSGLIAATIPGTVETIGDDAFHGCANLTSATVSEGVKTIGERAFQGCTSLAYIDFPASITSVGSGAFASCSKMTRVRFKPGTGTVAIGDNLFSQCQYLTDVTLPKTTDRISAGMFQSCTSLPVLYIPASVTEIGENPFTSCRFLQTINFGGSEVQWDSMASPYLKASLQSTGTTVVFDVEFDDPFAADPDDPGDFSPVDPEDPCKDGHTGTADENGNCSVCGKPMTTNPTVTDTPTVTNTPTVTGEPTATSEPTATNTPAVTDTPTITDTPGVTNPPIITNTPGVINTPIATNTPSVTDTPEVSGTPDETSAPDETGTPDATGTPSAPDDSENPSNTTVTENPDGSKTETTTSTVKTEDGTTIQTTEVVNKDSNGKVTGSSAESIISTDSENGGVSVVVNVKKNARGKITEATANIPDTSSFSGQRALIQGSAVKQITETAGTNSVTVSVEKKNGSNPYTAIVNTADLTAGNKLNVVIKKSNGDYILANAKKYTVDKNGDIFASMKGNQTYEFINSSKTIRKSKTAKMALKKTLNMENVKSIQYSISKKSVASVTKKGVVKGKKAGSAVVRAKVTLKNGKTKTVRMKVKVK